MVNSVCWGGESRSVTSSNILSYENQVDLKFRKTVSETFIFFSLLLLSERGVETVCKKHFPLAVLSGIRMYFICLTKAQMCSSASVPQEVSFDLPIFFLYYVTLISKRGKQLFLVQFNYIGQFTVVSE